MISEAIDLSQSQREILDRPVFVVGAPRSGTTWLQQLLVAAPQIVGGHESQFFVELAPVWRNYQVGQKGSRMGGLHNYWLPQDFHAQICQLWYRTMGSLLQSKPGATYLSEKSP